MKQFLLSCALIILSVTTKAQTTRSNVINFNAWFMYFGNHKISEKIGWHSEIQIRRSEIIAKNQQLLLRTGMDYYSTHYRFTLGYAFIETYPYGEFAVPNAS